MWDFLWCWWEQGGTLSSISLEAGGTVLNMPTEYLVCILFLCSLVKDSRQSIVTDQSSSRAGEALNLFLNSQFGSPWCVDSWGQRRQLNWGKPVCLFPLLLNFPFFFFFLKSSVTIVLIKPIYWGLWKILNYLFCRKYCVFFCHLRVLAT